LKIGIDLDGIITPIGFVNPSIKLPQILYIFLLPLALFMLPSQDTKNKLKKLSQDHEIIIISARPSWTKLITQQWLKFHKIPFSKLYCLGFGKGTKIRKLKVIKNEKIELFFEDNKRIREFLEKNSIKILPNLDLATLVLGQGNFLLKT